MSIEVNHINQREVYAEKKPEKPLNVIELSKELLVNIFSNLKIEDVQRSSLVCREFKQCAEEESLKRILFFRDFPDRLKTGTRGWNDEYRYAYRVNTGLRQGICSTHLLNIHSKRLTQIDAKRGHFFSSSADGTICIWKQTHQALNKVQTFEHCEEGVFKLCGDYLLTTAEGKVRIFKANEAEGFFELSNSLTCDGSKISQFYMQEDSVFLRSEKGELKIWKKNVQEEFILSGTLSNTYSMTVQGNFLFAVTFDGSIHIWKKEENGDFKEFSKLESVLSRHCRISWLYFENNHLITGSFDGTINIWYKDHQDVFKTLQSHAGDSIFDSMTQCIVKGDYIITGSHQGNLRVFKKRESERFDFLQHFKGHAERINAMTFEGPYLFTGSTDSTTKLWEFKESGELHQLQSFQSLDCGVTSLKVEGDRFLIGYSDGTIEIKDFGVERQ